MHILGLDAAHWPWPLGWFYLNVLGNLIASFIWAGPPFAIGVVWGKRRQKKTDEHREWMARITAKNYHHLHGEKPPPHPHHGDLL